MRAICLRLIAAGLTAFALMLTTGAVAAGGFDHDHDHDLARGLFEHGEIRALHDVLRVLHQQHPGEVVAVDLVKAGDKWVYRFQIIAPDGRRTIVDVDANAPPSEPGHEDDPE
jgi:uncharacterized membrane protein YkoI